MRRRLNVEHLRDGHVRPGGGCPTTKDGGDLIVFLKNNIPHLFTANVQQHLQYLDI